MLKIAALCLAAVSSIAATAATPTMAPSTTLDASNAWWEKITVTMGGAGNAQSCRYESSNKSSDNCEVVGDMKPTNAAAPGTAQVTSITFERRFTPSGQQPDMGKIRLGDTLLGGQILALAIDPGGKVSGCKIVGRSGEMTPDYGCNEVVAERFAAGLSNAPAEPGKHAYMTILVYGHEEHVA